MSFDHFTTGFNSISWGDLRAMVHHEARGMEDALLDLPGFSLSEEQFTYVFANVTLDRLTGFLKWQYQDGTALCDLPFDGQMYDDVSLVWGNNRVLRFENAAPVYVMYYDAAHPSPRKGYYSLAKMRETLARCEHLLETHVSYVHLSALALPSDKPLRLATHEALSLWAADKAVSFKDARDKDARGKT